MHWRAPCHPPDESWKGFRIAWHGFALDHEVQVVGSFDEPGSLVCHPPGLDGCCWSFLPLLPRILTSSEPRMASNRSICDFAAEADSSLGCFQWPWPSFSCPGPGKSIAIKIRFVSLGSTFHLRIPGMLFSGARVYACWLMASLVVSTG